MDINLINKWLKIGFFLLLTTSSTCNGWASEQTLKPFESEYIAYRWGDPVGKATMTLEKLAPQQYSLLYQSEVSKFFLSDKRTEHSIFSVSDNIITADKYHYVRTGTGKKKTLDVEFNDLSNKIDVKTDKESYQFDWNAETDNQLYRLMISHTLSIGKEDFEVDFINYRGEKKHYSFEVEGNETLDLPYGSLDAIKVHIKRNKSTRMTYAWFAPSLNYQLVRLQQFKDEKEQGDIKLSAFSFLTK